MLNSVIFSKQDGFVTPSCSEHDGFLTPSCSDRDGVRNPSCSDRDGVRNPSCSEQDGVTNPPCSDQNDTLIRMLLFSSELGMAWVFLGMSRGPTRCARLRPLGHPSGKANPGSPSLLLEVYTRLYIHRHT